MKGHVGDRPSVGREAGIPDVDVVRTASWPCGAARLDVKGAPRARKGAQCLAQKLGRTLARDADDVTAQALTRERVVAAVAHEPYPLPHEADPRGTRANLHPKAAVTPAQVEAERPAPLAYDELAAPVIVKLKGQEVKDAAATSPTRLAHDAPHEVLGRGSPHLPEAASHGHRGVARPSSHANQLAHLYSPPPDRKTYVPIDKGPPA